MTLDIDHLRRWIGRREEAQDLITPRLAAEYEATLAPYLAPVGAGEARLGLHWLLAPRIRPMAELGPDGHPARGDFLPPVPLPRRMWAGGWIEQTQPLRIGDEAARLSTIEDVTAKTGRSGSLCFVAVRHGYETARGVAIRERHDIVYRDAPAPGAPAPASAGEREERRPDLAWTVEPSPVLLFRYSAMTFNGHRIHYDHPYVTGAEGYAGLVVHGPIQATLLFNLAAALAGRTPARFSYRGLAPLTADSGAFRVCGATTPDGGIAAWTEGSDGRVRMRGEATF